MAEPRKFAVFDIDGTLIRWQLYHAVADKLAHQGYFDQAQYQKVREARMTWKKRTDDNSFKLYEQALVDLVDKSIAGMGTAILQQACHAVIDEYQDQVYTYTRDLIQRLKAQNYLLFTISASQVEIVKMLADHYSFDDYGGSEYEVANGCYTGKKEVLKRERKPQLLRQLVAKHNASFAGSIGVGDSESDIPMLQVVENPIAFNPTKQLFEHAQANNWKVVLERKNMIYELEPTNGKYILAQTDR